MTSYNATGGRRRHQGRYAELHLSWEHDQDFLPKGFCSLIIENSGNPGLRAPPDQAGSREGPKPASAESMRANLAKPLNWSRLSHLSHESHKHRLFKNFL